MKATKSVIMRMSVMLVIAALLVSVMVVTVSAATQSISYVERSLNPTTKAVTATTKSATATVVTADDTVLGEAGKETYYVVSSETTIDKYVTVNGTVHLIIGANYNLGTKNITVPEGATLHVHEASGVSGAALSLNAINLKSESSNVYIHGGTVNAAGPIGTTDVNGFGDIVIYGGTVTAGNIGVGDTDFGDLTANLVGIYGGNITVNTDTYLVPAIGMTGGDIKTIEIHNATVSAKKLPVRGSASDNITPVIGIRSGTAESIVINKSTLKVYSHSIDDDNYTANHSGPPIGSGDKSTTLSITITDSNIYIDSSNKAAGIGRGFNDTSVCESVTVSGSTIYICSGPYLYSQEEYSAGIAAKNVTVSSSDIKVEFDNIITNDPSGWGIYADETLTINSGRFDFKETKYGIESKGTLIINGGLFNSIVTGVTGKDSNGNNVCAHTITIEGLGIKDIGEIKLESGSYAIGNHKKNFVSDKITVYASPQNSITSVKIGSTVYGGRFTGTTEREGTFFPVCNCSSFTDGLCDNCGSREPAELVDGYYLIRDLDDYLYFEAVVEGTLKNGASPNGKVNAKLMADLTLGSGTTKKNEGSNYGVSVQSSGVSVGTEEYPFKGIFDGNNHTIIFWNSSPKSEAVTGLFVAAENATIKNLTVSGGVYSYVGSGSVTGGIVGITKGDKVTIENCIVNANYYLSGHVINLYSPFGGFVGKNEATELILNNVAYVGGFTPYNASSLAFIVGDSNSGAAVKISNSYIFSNPIFSRTDASKNGIFCTNEEDTYVTSSYTRILFTIARGGSGGMNRHNESNKLGANEIYDVSDKQVSNGYLAYIINQGASKNIWKQTLGGENPDAYPNFTGKDVQYNFGTKAYDNHEHNSTHKLGEVNTENDTIIISCEGCSADGDIMVTITPPSTTTYVPGKYDYGVTLTNADGFYVEYAMDGVPITYVPKAAGNYTASVTAGNVTASVEYTIEKYNTPPENVYVKTEVFDTMKPSEVELAIGDNIWKYSVSGYTVELTDEALYHDQKTYNYKITPTGTNSINNIAVITGTVEINVRDLTAPSVTLKLDESDIALDTNSDGTINYFVKSAKKLAVSASDTHGSGVDKVEYFISDDPAADLSTAVFTEVQDGEIDLPANATFFVFVRASDNKGNKKIVYTDGFVSYTDSVSETTSIEYTKFTDDPSVKLELNGNTVSKIMLGTDTTLSAGTDYSIAADGTVTFVGDVLDELEANTYEITVHYLPRGEEYLEADYCEEPAANTIALIVNKAAGKVTITNDIGKEYDVSAVGQPTVDTLSGGEKTVEYRVDEEGSAYGTEAPKNVGKYIVRVTVAADDYYTEASAEKAFEIIKAPLKVKANDIEITYGDEPAVNGVVFEGFKGDENEGVLGGELKLECDYEKLGAVGEYDITPSGYESSNYEISYENGKLTVLKKDVSFSTDEQIIDEGEELDNTKFSATGLIDGHRVLLSGNVNEIVVGKILDGEGVDVSANYNISYTAKGTYHCFAAKYNSDGEKHWRECMAEGCDDKVDEGECSGGYAICISSATCSTCGRPHGGTAPSVHSFTTYISDNNATAEADGTMTASCDHLCGATDTVTELGSRLEVVVDNYGTGGASSGGKETLEELVDEIDGLLNDSSLSEAKREELEATKAEAETLIEEVEAAQAAKAEAESAVDSYEADSVKSSDKESIEKLIEDIDALAESGKLTEEEKEELEATKAEAEALVAEINNVSESKADAERSVASYDSETLKSSDKERVEEIIGEIDALIESDKLTEEEKAELEETKAEAEALISEINEIAAEKTEAEEKLAGFETGAISANDKTELESLAQKLEALAGSENYTEEEKAELEKAKDDVEALILAIDPAVVEDPVDTEAKEPTGEDGCRLTIATSAVAFIVLTSLAGVCIFKKKY